MPFKFKLSVRLALMKASLAASAVLALACDRTDLTAPPAFTSPLTAAVTSLSTVTVVASAHDGNIPQNTLDNDLTTRWSASGDGQWIRYDLGALATIDRLGIAWYLGDTRIASFDIEVSLDTVTWTKVFSGRSSGTTLQLESYTFPTASGRYVRIVGHGNSASAWNSVTEVAIPSTVLAERPGVSAVASGHDGNIPQNTLDNDLATRWSASGDGQWIRYDLGALAAIDRLGIAWYLGDTRIASFDIEVSLDTVTWTRVFSGRSSGTTLQLESYTFPPASGRYVRIVGHGNSASAWNSVTEVAIPGTVLAELPVVSAVASADDGNVPQNTRDDQLATRWSAYGDGQWIRYDVGALRTVGRVDIAWHVGDTRKAIFDIELSPDAVTWTRVFSGQSSGTTLQLEGHTFPTASGRYVRIVGHGNSLLTGWNSITEVDIHGSAPEAVPLSPVASVTVTSTSAGVSVGSTIQLNAVLRDADGNVLTGRTVTWASSALGVATVSASGLVTALALGSAAMTATSEGQSGSAAVTVSGATPLYTLGNGKNYYAAPSGSDANPCTAAAPCYTMQRVSQLLQPGDNAHFASGNYTWSYSGNKVAKSGTASAPITYISDEKWGAKIYGTNSAPIFNDGDYVQIINFDVTGVGPEGIITNGHYSKVIGNRVHDLPASSGGAAGILGDCCYYNRTGIEIIGNVVDNIGPLGGTNLIHGIYLGGPNGVIMNNIVTRGSAACIHLYHGTTRTIIANNVAANCGRYGILISADGAITANDYTTVSNNIVVNTPGRGIYEFPAVGSHNVYNNNIVYNNTGGNFVLIDGTQSGTITLTSAQFSALFVNYTGDMRGDYHLRPGAVAIDAGTTSCAAGVTRCVPLLDFDGLPRPRGAAYDIGAYEY
jgi:uncharacterized protein YjdB